MRRLARSVPAPAPPRRLRRSSGPRAGASPLPAGKRRRDSRRGGGDHAGEGAAAHRRDRRRLDGRPQYTEPRTGEDRGRISPTTIGAGDSCRMGDSGTYFQRYTLARIRPKSVGSYIELKHGTATDRLGFDKWATVSGPMTGVPITGPVKIISGAVMPADIAPLTLSGAIVVFIQNPERPTENQQVTRALSQKGPAALVLVQNTDPAVVPAAGRRGATRRQSSSGRARHAGERRADDHCTRLAFCGDERPAGHGGDASRPDRCGDGCAAGGQHHGRRHGRRRVDDQRARTWWR